MVVAQVLNLPDTRATTEISLVDCEENSSSDVLGRGLNDERNAIVTVHYKPTFDKKPK